MKNKVILIDALNARSGGAVVIAHNLSEALSKIDNQSVKVILVQLDENASFEVVDNIEHVLIKADKYSLFYLLKWHLFELPELIKKYKVTHLIGLGGLVFGRYGSSQVKTVACINNALPFVKFSELRTLFPEIKYMVKWFLLRQLYCYSISSADKVLLSSQYMKDLIINSCRVKSSDIMVELTGHKESANKIRRDLESVTSEVPVLLYLSPLWRYKNHSVIIKALGVLRKNHGKRFKVFFAGGEYQKGVKIDIEHLAKKNDILSSVFFLGDVGESQRDELLTESDVLLYSSYYEANSIILSEYLSAGKPIISSDSASNKEVLKEAALYYEANDYLQLANNILILLEDRNLQAKLKENSGNRLKQLSWDSYATNILNEISGD